VLVAQSTLMTRPTDTTSFHVPHTLYESVSTTEPSAGNPVRNPTTKLFKPFTTTSIMIIISIKDV